MNYCMTCGTITRENGILTAHGKHLEQGNRCEHWDAIRAEQEKDMQRRWVEQRQMQAERENALALGHGEPFGV